MNNYGKKWKERIRKGETVIGGHVFLPNPAMAEAMAFYGYEYIWLDGEHGSFDKETIHSHLTAINNAGAGAFVRVTAGEPWLIKPVVEMGPDGIVFPQISTVEEARKALEACIYPPEGKRGYGPRRASRYGKMSDREYIDSVDESLVKIIQIEHVDGVNNLEKILDLKGIDGIVVGPYDLTASLNLLGQVTHPDVYACFEKIIAACKARSVPCGVSTGYYGDEYIRFWLDRKINFIFCGDDIAFIKAGTESTLAKLKNFIPKDASAR